MLLNLSISNFAIIDRLEVEFGEGFNVLTGETGAGKSIILDAFGLLLGDRARPDLVRSGADEATVEALFQLEAGDPVHLMLEEFGLPGCEQQELVLRRLVQSSGRSRAYVNGAMVTLGQLQPLAELLVVVCGQHEHQRLLYREAHLEILDSFGSHQPLCASYQESFLALQQVERRLSELDQDEKGRLQQLDLLQFQSQEIASANLCDGEENELLAERLLLQNAERLAKVAEHGYQTLYGAEGAICEQLGSLNTDLEPLLPIDANLGPLGELITRTLYDLEDAAAQFRQLGSRMNFEPGRLDQVETRLASLSRLKRKYASSVAEMLRLKEEIDDRIAALKNSADQQTELLKCSEALSAEVRDKGALLSQARQETARRIAAAIATELDDLAMGGARFEVVLEPLAEPAQQGLEKVEFRISANPGEPLMPLSKVVSGGELSRLMLALKRVAPEVAQVPTVIFDEVDAGIGGETATAVGRKLKKVSAAAQVVCVTHLPQVAAFAERHYRVSKRQSEGRTLAGVEFLAEDERVREMARMLAGSKISDQTLLHARELIVACCDVS